MNFNDYHIHTKYCDGVNTVDEMIESAISKGCTELGFSGHSYLTFDDSWTMSIKETKEYREEISLAKEKYKNEISVFCGLEEDYYACTPNLNKFDYVIGSVHCLFKRGRYVSIDESVESLNKGIQLVYGGDIYSLIADYYEKVGRLYDKTGCQIIGHFDLVTKFQEQKRLFDPADRRYKKAVTDALDKLLAEPVVFEINTGAMSRRYRSSPYPDSHILEYLSAHNARVILASDAHNKDDIAYGFPSAMNLVKRYKLNLVESINKI